MLNKPRSLDTLIPFLPALRRLAAILLLPACVITLSQGAIAEELPAAVKGALARANIPPDSVGIVVASVDGNTTLLQHNADRPMNPASTMKLVTTYGALELLGPAYTWKTDVLADTLPANGVLTGNLYLRGSGDPRLALEQFWLLLRQLHSHGIDRINGDLVLDRSAFAPTAHDPAAFDNEPLRPYNAGPDALLINLKSISLSLRADTARKTVQIVSDTPDLDVRLESRLTLTQEACGDWREHVHPSVNGDTITITGSYAARCGEKSLNLAPWSADTQVDHLFRALWQEIAGDAPGKSGGVLRGKVREGKTPDNARLLLTQDSPALGEIIRDVNKYSNNVMARQIFLTLASERPATTEAAARRLRGWLDDKELRMPELVLDNGSGLSRSERISADSMARLLFAAWRSPVMPELLASLPVAGVDGTLKKRLTDGASSGRAHLKTGYLENVRAIAGLVQDTSDQRWIVVCLINDANSRAGKPVIDALLNWVADR